MRKTAVFALLMVLVAGSAFAGEIRQDYFDGIVDAAGIVTKGLGQNTGWNDGQWLEYPQPEPLEPWWNEWFYNDPPLPLPNYKEISYNFCVTGPGQVEVALNWSTLIYDDPSAPPMPGVGEPFIVRELIYSGGATAQCGGEYIIPDFNPQWVSIDIRGYNVEVIGCITHQCVPEPGSLALIVTMFVSLAGLVAVRWRR